MAATELTICFCCSHILDPDQKTEVRLHSREESTTLLISKERFLNKKNDEGGQPKSLHYFNQFVSPNFKFKLKLKFSGGVLFSKWFTLYSSFSKLKTELMTATAVIYVRNC